MEAPDPMVGERTMSLLGVERGRGTTEGGEGGCKSCHNLNSDQGYH
jgi:hypothetical protein